MSITSTLAKVQFTITSLPFVAALPIAFRQASDLVASDGADILVLNSDWFVTGGGYNSANELQTGNISIVGTGANLVLIGDVVTIYRGISPVQTTTFSSTGLLTPLMIEQGDDLLTCQFQEVEGQVYNPFPPISGTQNIIFLGWLTAETGGIRTSIDSLDIVNVPTIELPLVILTSLTYGSGGGDGSQLWKLRPMQMGDPNTSISGAFIVPVTNPNSLIWVRIG